VGKQKKSILKKIAENKRKKSQKRKSQLRSKMPQKNLSQIPLESIKSSKLSEAVLEYAEPLLNHANQGKEEENAIKISILFWNASLLPKDEALQSIEPIVNMANGNPNIESKFYDMFEMMYNRKQSSYESDKRFIVNYSLEKNNDGYYLQVASTQFDNPPNKST